MKNKLPPALRRLCYGLGLMLMACLLVGAMFTMSLAAGSTTAEVTVSDNSTRTVTVTADPSEGGTVAISNAYLAGPYLVGAELSASPSEGWEFQNWTVSSGSATLSNSTSKNTTLESTSDVTATAHFVRTAYGVTVNKSGSGDGSATADRQTANAGDTVTLTAIPDRGSVFAGWTVESGDVTDLSYLNSTTATFTMPSGSVTVTARFDVVEFGKDEEDYEDEDVINLDVYQVLTKRLRVMPMNLNTPGTLNLRLGKEQEGLWGNLYRCPAQERLDVRDDYRSGNYEDLEFCSASLIEENGAAVWPLEYDAAYAYIAIIDTVYHTPWTNPFTDVTEDDPFYEAVQYVCENGVMPGVTETTFEPEAIVTRAQLLTILWQLEGSPAVEGELDFDDVEEDAWYGDAVRWAASTGLASGDGNGLFGAEDPLTREQLAVILFRYAVQFDGLAAVTLEENLTGFDDAHQIGPWAVTALNWAVGQGILSPESETALAPTAGVTRALLAQTLMNYLT